MAGHKNAIKWFGMVSCAVVWYGVGRLWCGVVCCGMVHGMVWDGMVWNGRHVRTCRYLPKGTSGHHIYCVSPFTRKGNKCSVKVFQKP